VEYYRLDGLQTTNIYFSQFWSLKSGELACLGSSEDPVFQIIDGSLLTESREQESSLRFLL
jgi:hypothetical protein